MVNQGLIARELRVSQATVSRSLRNDASIHPDTRAKVLSLAAQLGYRPDLSLKPRRSSAPRKLLHLGVLVQDDERAHGATVSRLLAGMTSAAQEMGVSLQIHHVADADRTGWMTDASKAPVFLREDLVRGVILLRKFENQMVDRLAHGMACVSVIHQYPGTVDLISSAETDHISEMVQHLAAKGHRRIAFATEQPDTSWAARRQVGYVSGLLAAGLPVDMSIVRPDLGTSGAFAAQVGTVRNLLHAGATAIACSGDSVAYRVIRILNTLGLRAGVDVSVTGYDQNPAPDGLPALTTIRVPFEEMGIAAIRTLQQRVNQPAAAPRQVLLRGQFVPGETVSTPADVGSANP